MNTERAAFFPALLTARNRAMLVSSAVNWLPGTLAITVALFVAAVIRSPRLSPDLAGTVALVFEIASVWSEQRAREWWERHQPLRPQA